MTVRFPPLENDAPPYSDRDAAAVGVRPRVGGWPYGPNGNEDGAARDRLVAWATAHGLRLVDGRTRFRMKCLHWVAGQARRCGALQESLHEGVIGSRELSEYAPRQVMDHVTFWQAADGTRIAIAQPYEDIETATAAVGAIERRWPILRGAVYDTSQWYGFGTIGVELIGQGEAKT